MEANFSSTVYLPDQHHLHSLDGELPVLLMSELDAVEDVRGFLIVIRRGSAWLSFAFEVASHSSRCVPLGYCVGSLVDCATLRLLGFCAGAVWL